VARRAAYAVETPRGNLPVMRRELVGIMAVLCACLSAQVGSPEKIDLSVAQQIRHEAFGQNSKVMDSAF
jgi:hypothetical protein